MHPNPPEDQSKFFKIQIVASDIAINRLYEGNQDLTVRKGAVASLWCACFHACHFSVAPSGRSRLQTLLQSRSGSPSAEG